MSRDPFWGRTPRVVGHRGSPRKATENTIAAFDAAVAAGAEMVEFDVRRSIDGVLFIFHGFTLPGNSALRRVPVSALTFAQICETLSESPRIIRNGRIQGGAAPPRFDDVIAHLAGRVKLDIEIKEAGYEAEVLAVLARHLAADDYVVTSFREPIVATCKALAPDIRVGLIFGSRGKGQTFGLTPFRCADRCGADFIVMQHLRARTTLLNRAQKRGVPVLLYTVDRQRRLRSLLKDNRVAAVITDSPDVALRLRDGRGGASI